MLTSAPTKYGAGITLFGDFLDLDTLHKTIHKIAKEGFAEEHVGDFILGLAYDVRKAKDQMREKRRLSEGNGVKRDWTDHAGRKIPSPVSEARGFPLKP